jgi:PDDEXK-like domain of unknown function (DUF3799)
MSFLNCKILKVGADSRLYHDPDKNAKRGEKDFQMSSSSLRAFDGCPARWYRGYSPPDTEAKDFGNLLDCALLTPDQTESRHAVQPPHYDPGEGEKPKKWNNNATVCREWTAAQKEKGLEIITTKEEVAVQEACQSIRRDEIAAAFIDASDKQVWIAGEWLDEKTDLIIPAKCLIDLVPRADTEYCKCVGDLKTTRNAKPEPWSRWCYTAGYFIQAAWNLDMLVAATGEDRVDFCFLLVENYEPWQTAKRLLSGEFMSLGRAEYTRMMALYARCLAAAHWPGYDETDEAAPGGWTITAPEPWQADKGMFAPHYVLEDEPEGEPEPQMVNDLIP